MGKEKDQRKTHFWLRLDLSNFSSNFQINNSYLYKSYHFFLMFFHLIFLDLQSPLKTQPTQLEKFKKEKSNKKIGGIPLPALKKVPGQGRAFSLTFSLNKIHFNLIRSLQLQSILLFCRFQQSLLSIHSNNYQTEVFTQLLICYQSDRLTLFLLNILGDSAFQHGVQN
ncbi:hypothetical protein ABPG74_008402 [Tetrahymena malaccensis]